jgi:nucleotide-binding universal stress UspA family protein
MFARIVIGIDGRQGGRDALALAQRLAAPGAELILASVVVVSPLVSPMGGLDHDESAHAAARAHLAAARKLASVRGIPGRVRSEVVQAASPAAGLHRLAAHAAADLIAIGSCTRGPVGRLLEGDDTRQTLHRPPCAVAVAPHVIGDAGLNVIGLAWDGGAGAEHVLEVASDLAEGTGAELTAIEVLPLARWALDPVDAAFLEATDSGRAEAESRLRELVGAGARVAEGVPFRKLVEFSEEVDLLVVGCHDRGPLERFALGATAEQVARHVACPLVAVPIEEQSS